MNNSGINHLKWTNKLRVKFKSFENYSWDDSRFQERLARCGGEFRRFKIEDGDTKNIEQIVNASLFLSDLRYNKIQKK